MYNIHDFLNRKCNIVIRTQEEYNLAMKWFRQYNLKYCGKFIDERYSFLGVHGAHLCASDILKLEDILNNNISGSLDVGSYGEDVSIKDMDFEENRLEIKNQRNDDITFTFTSSTTGTYSSFVNEIGLTF